MKMILITFFAAASALIAAETNSPAPTQMTNTASVLQIPIVEQAELVQQIGEEAAKGFDSVEHARSLRAQIEALVSSSTPPKPAGKSDAMDNPAPTTGPATKAPAFAAPSATATPAIAGIAGRNPAALEEAIRILRAEADRLEAQLQKLSRQP
jgi:hypothetical protein